MPVIKNRESYKIVVEPMSSVYVHECAPRILGAKQDWHSYSYRKVNAYPHSLLDVEIAKDHALPEARNATAAAAVAGLIVSARAARVSVKLATRSPIEPAWAKRVCSGVTTGRCGSTPLAPGALRYRSRDRPSAMSMTIRTSQEFAIYG
jgi:hypothetical protein